MRLTHPEYIKLVFRTYQLLRSTPEISPALKQPTPASIRKECLTVYKERPDKKDEPVLRSFFGPAEENKSFLTPIDNFPTDGFRAFSNYLKGRAAKTDDKNVELLAWLIDFPHRPFRFGMDVILSEREKAILNSDEGFSENLEKDNKEEEDDKAEEIKSKTHANEQEAITITTNDIPVLALPISLGNDTRSGEKHLPVNRQWLTFWVPLVFAILSLGFYLLYDKGAECMYWTGDHYEKIDCDADVKAKDLLNEERWKNFRKITNPDTITAWSIGKLYYLKTNNVIEYFTAGGKHPVYVTRTLKVLSQHMFDTYLRNNSVGVDSSAESQTKSLTNR
ncbi:MAG TPA: hypothetical protein DHW64_08655 [Chitinophagaceae bacterium]|nr:hypothetical protein [Chitinophagaceae bacterium]